LLLRWTLEGSKVQAGLLEEPKYLEEPEEPEELQEEVLGVVLRSALGTHPFFEENKAIAALSSSSFSLSLSFTCSSQLLWDCPHCPHCRHHLSSDDSSGNCV